MSEPEPSVGEQLVKMLDERYIPRRGRLQADVTRSIDLGDCEPLRPEDSDWGEQDSLENVPRYPGASRWNLASENGNRIGPVRVDPVQTSTAAERFEQFREFQATLAKRYRVEKLAATNASAFDRALVPLPRAPWWRRMRGVLRWWWICVRALCDGAA